MEKIPVKVRKKMREIVKYFSNISMRDLEDEYQEIVMSGNLPSYPVRWRRNHAGHVLCERYKEIMSKINTKNGSKVL